MSTILSADDLNDFIAPGVACVKPVEIEKTQETAVIEIGADGVPVERLEDGSTGKLKQAQISLTDCLACSGCVTSSEAFLVELQSPKEVLKALEDRSKVFVVSISHQSRVSLAQAFDIPVEQVDGKLEYLFAERLGFQYVIGTEIGRAVALEQSALEAMAALGQGQAAPILSSICPGWAVYAEKTHPHVLPFLSKVRSPQQITGRLAKTLISQETGVSPSDIYHLSIMPCFDKKLEASREEFSLEDGGREVDIVITAREILQMLNDDLNLDFAELPMRNASVGTLTPRAWPAADQWKSNIGSSSGGYLAYVLARAQMARPDTDLVRIEGKNSDLVDYQLVDKSTGEVVFRGAQIYGFRNIQNLVRKLKPAKTARKVVRRPLPGRPEKTSTDPSAYNYVEVMACPGGCVNGGGQVGAPENVPARLWTEQLDKVYRSMALTEINSEHVAGYLESMGVVVDDKLVHAEYKAVEKTSNLPEAVVVAGQW